MKVLLRSVVAGVIALSASGAAFALPAASTAFTSGVVNNLSDDFGEIVIQNDGNSTIDVGDYLFATLGITSYAPSGVSASAVNELTIITALQVSSFSGLPSGACGGGFAGSCGLYGFSAITAPGGIGALLATFGIAPTNAGGLSYTANTVGIVLEDGTPDFTTSNLSTGWDGDLRMVVDLDILQGDFYTAVGPTSQADFLANTIGEGIGSFSLNLTVSGQDFAGWFLGPDLTGRGNLSRAEDTAQSPIGGDASFFLFAQRVPEPGSLALVGLALVGLGAVRRRK